ncbi:MAG: hypothetical protein WA003_06485 [Desulfuromonadaceae bacterium]
MRTISSHCLLFTFALMLAACGSQRPILYPNSQLKEVGQSKANQEIDDCIRLATEYQAGGDKTREIAKETGKAGVVGAATGAVIGVITGDIGRATAIGGAGVATATMGSGIMSSDEPDPVFKQFVDQCLRDKGFQPIGWR